MSEEEALRIIASCSPAMTDAGGESQRHCRLCEAMINEARTARGEELWPAIPHTPTELNERTRQNVDAFGKEFARLLEIERLAIAFVTTRQRNAESFFAADVWAFSLAIFENLKKKEIK